MTTLAFIRKLGVALPFFLFASMAETATAANLPDFTKLVDRTGPAVVNISTTRKVKRKGFGSDLFKHFNGEKGEQEEEFSAQASGSGFIISPEGYVLTNYHVVADAEEVVVRLTDRRELTAEVVGTDEKSDVAVLKLTVANDLPVVRIGNPEKLKVGAWVFAIGSPYGFEHSVTAGIVSAKGRSLPRANYVPFIQTDVAINQGNSGGPLFNLDGEVVGINSQIISRTGGYMGLSFAIPIDVVMEVVDQIKDGGQVKRGWLGIVIQDVTRKLAESFGMQTPKGALVSKVLPDSPAEEAGFKVSDVVIEFNGRTVTNSGSLPPIVGRTPVGKAVKAKVIRSGKTKTLSVKIGELPSDDELRVSRSNSTTSTNSRLGLVIGELSDEIREAMDIPEYGVIVERIKKGSGSDAGLRKGDVIMMINNVSIENRDHFKELVSKLEPNKSAALLIQRRNGPPTFLALKVPE